MTNFTQSTDITETTNVGIPYANDSDSWTIDTGFIVCSTDNIGVFSDKNGSTLINNGNIFSGSLVGVYSSGSASVITNNSGHSNRRSAVRDFRRQRWRNRHQSRHADRL
jgi:hypothetical protein